GDALERATLEIAAADEANHVLAAAAGHAERMRQREVGEGLRVGAGGGRDVEALEIRVERRAAVELEHLGALAVRDQHRLADALPAVADTDPERCVGAESRGDDAALDQLAVEHLERP